MCFPNQSWSWNGISASSDRNSVPMPGDLEVLEMMILRSWKGGLHIVYLNHCGFLCLMHNIVCSFSKPTSHYFSVNSRQRKILQPSTYISRLLYQRRAFILVPTYFSFLQGDPFQCHRGEVFLYLLHIPYSNTHIHTDMHTLYMMSPSLKLRILWALSMAQCKFCLTKLSHFAQVVCRPCKGRKCITPVYISFNIQSRPLHTIHVQESTELDWMNFYYSLFLEIGTFKEGVWERRIWGIIVDDRSFIYEIKWTCLREHPWSVEPERRIGPFFTTPVATVVRDLEHQPGWVMELMHNSKSCTDT